ncbi:hypothetical protein J4Q44_G00143180 [Coregonus suidteri]|uniref:Uncharacterized protein n=1 Tax=Coregonus suidteri TaxID=861788 RepID=A0AAN8LR03_9TELE
MIKLLVYGVTCILNICGNMSQALYVYITRSHWQCLNEIYIFYHVSIVYFSLLTEHCYLREPHRQ